MKHAIQNCVTEWAYTSAKKYADPFSDVELDVEFTGPDGAVQRVPAFWTGGGSWRVRYASPQVGRHRYRTICSDATHTDLHGREGELEVAPYEGTNPLLKHGPVKVSRNRRYFEHQDGTPFFWLADTWWMGLCKRMSWPGDFQRLAADRVAKGFSVVQIIAGLYPDMPAFDERGANEAGFPWEKDYSRINPDYFDMADLRIEWLVKSGLVPCIVGCWGYFLPWMGVEKMKKHWRNLVARYGAYPVVWCLAGEWTMAYYLSQDAQKDIALQKAGWAELGAYLRQVDPYRRPVTIHQGESPRKTLQDASAFDFDMLQTGHGDRQSLPNTANVVKEAYGLQPTIPILNGEVCYEGIGEACRQEVQRLMFWVSVLTGACGHTYGANGIWQLNTRERPFGPSPHGMAWGHTPWDEASQLPGSGQVGLAKRLLERYAWWQFESHPEWVEPHWTVENYFQPYAAGIPGKVRVIYCPLMWGLPVVKAIEADVAYRAFLFNPANGTEHDMGAVKPDADGNWKPAGPPPWSMPPIYQDWVLVLERR